MGTILFSNNGISPAIKDKAKLKQFLVSVFENENVQFKSVSYIFCKDDYLVSLNQRYLNHDTLTDILTFTLSDRAHKIISEIYISIERVRENSIQLKSGYYQELYRVMIHGILHLCGYSDHTPRQKSLMRKREDFYLSQYSFT